METVLHLVEAECQMCYAFLKEAQLASELLVALEPLSSGMTRLHLAAMATKSMVLELLASVAFVVGLVASTSTVVRVAADIAMKVAVLVELG